MINREMYRERTEINFDSKHGRFLKEILLFYVPLLKKLPKLRYDKDFMKAEVKFTGASGVRDVATEADKWMQAEIKSQIRELHPEWQFWGEEGSDATIDDQNEGYLFITDPIEGTNNFRSHNDEQWGSVAAVVDMETKDPIIGIVGQPTQNRVYVGVKGEGAFEITYGEDDNLTNITELPNSSEHDTYTYNNSPHFELDLIEQVKRFRALGELQEARDGASELEKSRPGVILKNGSDRQFVDVESGALEPILHKGVIMFKTSLEMAAIFAIAGEIGAKVTDADGNPWSPAINTLIFGRSEHEWGALKEIYDKTR